MAGHRQPHLAGPLGRPDRRRRRTALADLVSLTSLNLSGNKIGPEGAQALADLVNLAALDLWYLGYDEEGAIGPFGGQALKQLINLTSLNLSGDRIRAKGAQALSGLRNLTSLNFAVAI